MDVTDFSRKAKRPGQHCGKAWQWQSGPEAPRRLPWRNEECIAPEENSTSSGARQALEMESLPDS